MTNQQDLAVRQFGSTAARYLASPVHATGTDLERLAALAGSAGLATVLDVGCGAGHASFALARGGAASVIAYDLSAQMLDVVRAEAAARNLAQVETMAGSAERLPFKDARFDAVVTRFSAHHWVDVRAALGEVARVLKPGGVLIVIDVIAPENPLLDTALQTLELLRDLSHVRNYRESEWRSMLEPAGFSVHEVIRWKLPLQFGSWVTRIGTSPLRVSALEAVIDELPAEVRGYFEVTAARSLSMPRGSRSDHHHHTQELP